MSPLAGLEVSLRFGLLTSAAPAALGLRLSASPNSFRVFRKTLKSKMSPLPGLVGEVISHQFASNQVNNGYQPGDNGRSSVSAKLRGVLTCGRKTVKETKLEEVSYGKEKRF